MWGNERSLPVQEIQKSCRFIPGSGWSPAGGNGHSGIACNLMGRLALAGSVYGTQESRTISRTI